LFDTPLMTKPVTPGKEDNDLLDVMQEVMHLAPSFVYDYLIGVDADDNITLDLTHSGKWNGDVEWLQRVAKYIVPSEVCLEMEGEDSSRWGYAFDGVEMIELEPEIIWPKVLEQPQVSI